MDGVLIVDKPCGPTSHDVVARVRRATGWAKVGHTGTLDPLATGVLALVVGRATRLAQFLSAAEKVYEAEVRLGWATDTYDAQGTPIGVTDGTTTAGDCGARRQRQVEAGEIAVSDLERALDRFRGTYDQAPPPFSAKKIGGVRSYQLARTGAPAQAREVRVTVHDLFCLGRVDDRIRLRLTCSAGFYVRTFAHELGRALGTGGHLSALRRTRSGDFGAADAVALAAIEHEAGTADARLVPLERLLTAMPAVVVTAAGATRTRHGNTLRPQDLEAPPAGPPQRVRVFDAAGTLLAIAEPAGEGGVLHPAVVVG